jgi:hypothetical protein
MSAYGIILLGLPNRVKFGQIQMPCAGEVNVPKEGMNFYAIKFEARTTNRLRALSDLRRRLQYIVRKNVTTKNAKDTEGKLATFLFWAFENSDLEFVSDFDTRILQRGDLLQLSKICSDRLGEPKKGHCSPR